MPLALLVVDDLTLIHDGVREMRPDQLKSRNRLRRNAQACLIVAARLRARSLTNSLASFIVLGLALLRNVLYIQRPSCWLWARYSAA
jgi:hypothetical protein